MGHLTFTSQRIQTEPTELWQITSHNFPEFTADGSTEEQAINNLNRKIIYYKDNNPKDYLKRIKDRVQRGWKCGCGEPLRPDDLIVGVWGS